MNLKVVIEEDTEDGGYVVSCPALPGCHSQGETVEEALANIEDAIRGCIEALNDRACPCRRRDRTRRLRLIVPGPPAAIRRRRMSRRTGRRRERRGR